MGIKNNLALIVGVAVVLLLGVLIGRLTVDQPGTNEVARSPIPRAATEDELIEFLLQEISEENIANYLRNLTLEPHLAGTPQEKKLADYLYDFFDENGYYTEIVNYTVLLSYPDKDNPNQVTILTEDGTTDFRALDTQPPLWAPEENSSLVQPNFVAYSASGLVEGEPVFANYGLEEDFKYLESQNISVQGKIVLAKYGKIFRGNIVNNAEVRGAAGVLLYPDPQDYAAEGRDFVYPDSLWMPGVGAPSGSIYIGDGDPQTYRYPSTADAYRLPEDKVPLPKIPAQPISYDDAEQILRRMAEDNPSPPSWKGNLNASYSLGPGFRNREWKIQMDIRTSTKLTTIYNVIATIEGGIEHDRYVILGSHRDAWSFGGSDPSSATATQMELARAIGKAFKVFQWRPRRAIVFCSWAAEEYGLIGSYEWAEENAKLLGQRAVAYLNLDESVVGNYSIDVTGVPLLYDLAYSAAKLVPNPNPEEVAAGRNTIFDTWLYRFPDMMNPSRPRINLMGSGSDFRPFLQGLGIPCLDFVYRGPPEMPDNPLYHTLYETYHHIANMMDIGFHYSAAVAKFWGIMAIKISEAHILPFNPLDYADFLKQGVEDIEDTYGELLQTHNMSLDHINEAVRIFEIIATYLFNDIQGGDEMTDLSARKESDRLMAIEKAFIVPWGLFNRPIDYHIVFTPSIKNSYEGKIFAGLTDLLDDIQSLEEPEQSESWEQVKIHLAEICHYIRSASLVMADQLFTDGADLNSTIFES